ncbi:MAG: nitrous oxide reductase family maturation protein NosD [Kofleriaceae bacterium]
MRLVARGLVALAAFAACGDSAATGGDGGGLDDADIDGAPPPPACSGPTSASGADGTAPGVLTAPNPTLRHATLHWLFSGDTDEDAVVRVRFRVENGTWRQGAPLFRVPAGTTQNKSWPDRFTGSVFDLVPDTAYEVELALDDPDGGCETRTQSIRTRPVPAPMAGAPVIAVTSGNVTAMLAAAQPGQILELAAGTYSGFTVTKDGAPGMPIVIRAAPGATVNVTSEVRLDGRSHVIVQGLTIAGQIKFNSATNLAIVGNRITTTADGIVTKLRSEDLYIADNIVIGATLWNEGALGVTGTNIGEGIEVTGPGHVIEHNRVSGFRDCISLIEDAGAVDQFSIDILRNDLSECADDAIEADFCSHDCRVIENRQTNVFIAMSSQPGLGGPTYFIRNVVYNALLTPFKLQRGSVGDVLIGNTIVKRGDAFGIYTTDVYSRQFMRNNLFLGGPGGTYNTYDVGTGRVIEQRAANTATISMDYDGYGSTTGAFAGRLGATSFASLAELRAMTSEMHAVQIDATDFATPAVVPASPFPPASPPDLRLASGGAAVDVGIPIPNITDGFAGAAPDLGAYELGAALPVYGPR